MKHNVLSTFTFGDARLCVEKVGASRYRLRVERVVHDEIGPVRCDRHVFDADVVELEKLTADLARSSIRMNHWLQEYARVVHRREEPETKSALGLRLE